MWAEPKEEIIICAAIWYQNTMVCEGLPVNINYGIVITGHRHYNCLIIGRLLLGEAAQPAITPKVDGFLTNMNRFFNREESFIIAKQAKQLLSDRNYRDNDELFSEDIY